MSFLERLYYGLRFIFGGHKQLATMIPAWREGQPAWPELNFENLVRHGWRKNELIFACIAKTANTAASVRIEIVHRPTGEVLKDHPAQALIRAPNPHMNQFDLWASVIIYQKLAGVAYYEKERSAAGRVVRLWPLRPDWVQPVLSSQGLQAYQYAPPGLEPVLLEPRDVLAFRLWDPLGLFRHWPPAAVAARAADVDNEVTDYIKLFFEEGGVPPGIFTTTQSLVEAQIEHIRAMWRERYGGWRNWAEPIILHSGASYQKTGVSVEEIGFEALDARTETRICMVLDVPPIIVGAKAGLDRATYANYQEARRSWWEDTLIPMYANLLDAVQNGLLAEFGDDLEARWDFSRVPALQEAQAQRWERALEALKSGGITRNEFRAEVGLPTLGPPGDVFLVPINVVEVPAPTAKEALPADYKALEKQVAENAPDDEERRRMERRMEREVRAYFRALLDRIREALEQLPIPLGEGFWTEERQHLAAVLSPLLLRAAQHGARTAVDLVTGGKQEVEVSWELINAGVIAWVEEYLPQVVGQITGTNMRAFLDAFGPWLESGEPLDALIRALEPVYGPVRAEMIAVTEVTRAFAQGNLLAWQRMGFVHRFRFRTAVDELVCPICRPNEGQVFPLEDTQHQPPLHVRCRCWLQPVVEGV